MYHVATPHLPASVLAYLGCIFPSGKGSVFGLPLIAYAGASFKDEFTNFPLWSTDGSLHVGLPIGACLPVGAPQYSHSFFQKSYYLQGVYLHLTIFYPADYGG